MARIAIVDDSIMILDFLTEILEDQGHCVLPCLEADNVEEKLSNFSPDLIFLDVLMPRSGYEVLRSLKCNEAMKNTPVILVTSKGETNDIKWGLKQGAVAYITKPFTPRTIFLAIKPHLLDNISK